MQTKHIIVFVLLTFLFSWPFFFVGDIWLSPMFFDQGNRAAGNLVGLAGHMLGMAGPAVAAILMSRLYHKEPLPSWKWGHPKYYGLVALAMLALWAVPAMAGLIAGVFTVRNPVTSFIWVMIGLFVGLGWFAGLGEEIGWCTYLLPRLAPRLGKTGALAVSGVIRGLWHWPIMVAPVIIQVAAGEKTIGQLVILSLVFALQLAWSNIFFGAVFGWVWYKTESAPLLGWLHQWYDMARDTITLLVIGYAGSIGWTVAMIAFVTVGVYLLLRVAREEGSKLWTWMQALEGKKKS